MKNKTRRFYNSSILDFNNFGNDGTSGVIKLSDGQTIGKT